MVTQDNIYELLKHYLKEKGLLAEQEIKTGWNYVHDKIFKEHLHFGLGFAHPIHMPTAIEHIPEAIRNDAIWLEGEGAALWAKITGKQAEVVAAPASAPAAPAPAPASTPVPAAAGGPQFNTDDKGDLSFAFQTGVNQVRPSTPDQALATEVTTKTDAVASEIATGETVTADTLAADKAVDQKADAEVAAQESTVPTSTTSTAPDVQPTQTVTADTAAAPAPAPVPAPASAPAPAVDDLHIDGA